MITVANIPMKPKPKPRGQLNKQGRMTHSLNGYREWQRDFGVYLKEIDFSVPESFYSIVFQFNLCRVGGRPPDLSNLQGGVEDALVKHGYIKDDNWKVIKRYYTFGKLSNEPSIIIYVCESKNELMSLISKLDD